MQSASSPSLDYRNSSHDSKFIKTTGSDRAVLAGAGTRRSPWQDRYHWFFFLRFSRFRFHSVSFLFIPISDLLTQPKNVGMGGATPNLFASCRFEHYRYVFFVLFMVDRWSAVVIFHFHFSFDLFYWRSPRLSPAVNTTIFIQCFILLFALLNINLCPSCF